MEKAQGKAHKEVKRTVGDAVTATINGQTVTWMNKYPGPMDKEAAGNADNVPHGVGDMVTATIDGQIVSWMNEYTGPAVASSTNALVKTTPSTFSTVLGSNPANLVGKASSILSAQVSKASAYIGGKASSVTAAKSSWRLSPLSTMHAPSAASSTAASSTSAVRTSSSGTSVPSGSWGRQAYYNAAQEKAEGLVFLNHFGTTNALPG